MPQANELLSKYSKIALADDKLKAVEVAMDLLAEDATAIRKIRAAQNKAISDTIKISSEFSSRTKENPKKKKGPSQEAVKEKPRLSVVERARLVYGYSKPEPTVVKASRLTVRQPKIAPMHNLVHKYMSMGAEDLCNPNITDEMRSLKLM